MCLQLSRHNMCICLEMVAHVMERVSEGGPYLLKKRQLHKSLGWIVEVGLGGWRRRERDVVNDETQKPLRMLHLDAIL